MLKGKKILIGITGSIAAYKSILLIRLLIKAGAEVKVMMTAAANDFVSKLTLTTLSKNPVLSDLADEYTWNNHVLLGRWADVMILAPLSCNTLAKMAHGQCDNLLLAVYLSATCPVVIAPAMDEDMWNHPATKENLAKLSTYGTKIIPVEKGDLASGLTGEGRMAGPETIFQFLTTHFFLTGKLNNKKVLVTAGPTFEPIDPVRFIGNYSSGKMGVAIAQELQQQGAQVTLVMGPSQINFSSEGMNLIRVTSADEMYRTCKLYFKETDLLIMAAAVADYKAAVVADEKIKKSSNELTVEFIRTKDILQSLGKNKRNNQVVVGFALETNNEKINALEKLKSKNADLIILNSLNDPGAGFGTDTNKITIFDKSGKEFKFDTLPKNQVARNIINTIIHLYYE